MTYADSSADIYTYEDCVPSSTHPYCLTGGTMTMGTHAGYGKFLDVGTAGGATCYAYVFHDVAGWHSLESPCIQNLDIIPIIGQSDMVRVDTCANVRAGPGPTFAIMRCLPGYSDFQVDGGPDYVADSGQAGMLWWHLAGQGWMAHQYLLNEAESPCLDCPLPAAHCPGGSQSSATLFGTAAAGQTHLYDNFPLPPQTSWGWNNAAGFVGVSLCTGGSIEEITAFVDTQLEVRGFHFLGTGGCMGGGSLITQCWAAGPDNRYGFTYGLSSPANWMVGFRKP
jgi:hypothetical protein